MEKVFEAHIHHLKDIPLKRAIDIFAREFKETGVKGGCFLSVPHEGKGGEDDYECLQNLKMLYLKRAFSPDFYAYAALVHPTDYSDKQAIKKEFLRQVKEYFSVGYDGIKMLEGYPSLLKARGIPLDDEIYDDFYAFMEANGYPITIHIANPQESWDKNKATPQLIAAGRVYDETFPTKQEITEQLFRVMEKYPCLRMSVAHFGFFIGEKENAERFLGDYKNTYFDITPGGGQYFKMLEDWEYWYDFIKRYQDRIFYGTDFYAFNDENEENWKIAVWRRPNLIRQFFETDTCHEYVGTPFKGVKLEKQLRDKIYRENAKRMLGGEPKAIDEGYIKREAEKLTLAPYKKYTSTDEDLKFILEHI